MGDGKFVQIVLSHDQVGHHAHMVKTFKNLPLQNWMAEIISSPELKAHWWAYSIGAGLCRKSFEIQKERHLPDCKSSCNGLDCIVYMHGFETGCYSMVLPDSSLFSTAGISNRVIFILTTWLSIFKLINLMVHQPLTATSCSEEILDAYGKNMKFCDQIGSSQIWVYTVCSDLSLRKLFHFEKQMQRLYGPGLMPYANKKGADQPAHARSLISTFLVRCLDSMICILAQSKVSRF